MFTACQGCGFPRNVGGQKRRGSVPFIICDRCTQRVRHGKCCLCDNPPAEGSFRCESCSDVDRSADTAVRAEGAYMEQLLASARARLTPHFARAKRFKHRRAKSLPSDTRCPTARTFAIPREMALASSLSHGVYFPYAYTTNPHRYDRCNENAGYDKS